MAFNLQFDSTFWGLFMQFILFCLNLSFLIYLGLREKGRVESPRSIDEIKVNGITSRYK